MSTAIPSDHATYGAGAIAFHWVAAALIVFLGVLGLLLEDFPRSTQEGWVNVHGCVGLVYLLVVLARVGWRIGHRPPDLPPHVGELSQRLSYPVHLLLYALMLAIPAVGIVAFVWHGRAFDFGLFKINFGVPSTRGVFHQAEDIHSLLAYALFGLAGFHALAALWHRFVLKDSVLARMLPGVGPGNAR